MRLPRVGVLEDEEVDEPRRIVLSLPGRVELRPRLVRRHMVHELGDRRPAHATRALGPIQINPGEICEPLSGTPGFRVYMRTGSTDSDAVRC